MASVRIKAPLADSITTRQKIITFISNNKILSIIFFVTTVLTFLQFQISERGLVANYYDNQGWKGNPVFTNLEKQIYLGTYELASDIFNFPAHNISIAWNGWIRIDQERMYQFLTISDDGSSVIINGELVVDNGGYHGPKQASGEIFLSKGMHQININYFNGAGGDGFSAFWIDQTGKQTEIPSDILFPNRLPKVLEIFSQHIFILRRLSSGVWLFLFLLLFLKHRDNLAQCLKRRYIARKRTAILHIMIHVAIVAFAIITISKSMPSLPSPVNSLPISMKLDYLGKPNVFLTQKSLSAALACNQNLWLGSSKLIRKYCSPQKIFCTWQLGDSGKLGIEPELAFYSTLRYLYNGRTIYFPQTDAFHDAFNYHEIKKIGKVKDIRFYPQNNTLAPIEAESFNNKFYHRFVYNPYIYNPIYKTSQFVFKDSSHISYDKKITCPTVESDMYPILIFLIEPKDKEIKSDIIAIQFNSYLYLIPEDQLPKRLKGLLYD